VAGFWLILRWLGGTFLTLLFNWTFWLVVLFIGVMQYCVRRDPVQAGSLTISALASGILGGILGSLLLVLIGITVNTTASSLLLVTSLVLMLFRPRFICFSYAGGLLSLLYIIFGYPQVDVPQIMGLVAVLHWVEALLIRLTGDAGSESKIMSLPDGIWQRGHVLNRIWPLPLVALTAFYAAPEALLNKIYEMPGWWPLIPANEQLLGHYSPGLLAAGGELHYALVPVTAVLGYNDETVGQTPRQRAKSVSNQLLLYSLTLLILCWVASRFPGLAIVPAIFGPAAHDYLICSKNRHNISIIL
jgi:hypothetical protein